MPKPQRHLFVCVNERPPENPKGCCAAKGGEALAVALKDACRRFGKTVRVSRAKCLGPCEQGANVVVYSAIGEAAVWYGGVQLSDVDEIVTKHLEGGKPVQRLINSEME